MHEGLRSLRVSIPSPPRKSGGCVLKGTVIVRCVGASRRRSGQGTAHAHDASLPIRSLTFIISQTKVGKCGKTQTRNGNTWVALRLVTFFFFRAVVYVCTGLNLDLIDSRAHCAPFIFAVCVPFV